MARQKHNWTEILKEQESSGMTISAFCKMKNIHPNMLFRNRNKKNKEFVEIKKPIRQESMDEIILSTKHLDIRIKPDFNPEILFKIITAISEYKK